MGTKEAGHLLEELAAAFQAGAKPRKTHVYGGDESGHPAPGGSPDAFETSYRLLLEQIPAVVFLAFLDRGVSEAYVSPHIETVLGFSQEEWLSDPVLWYRQIHPDDRERWSREAADFLTSSDPLRSLYRVRARDGRWVWFHCEVKLVRRDDGQPWLVHGVAFDITDLKEAQQALQAAHDELEARVRQRTAELTKTVAALEVEIGERKRVEEELQELNRTLERRVLERTQELHRSNAELARDIAERKRLEQQLLHAQKMESIGTLAAGIAHDFNNVLTIIRGHAAQAMHNGERSKELEGCLNVIQTTVDRAAGLVEQLLTFAQKKLPAHDKLDVNHTANELAEMARRTFPKTIQLTVELDPLLGPIRGDRNQIYHALLNVLVNARDAMPNGGNLRIRTRAVSRSALAEKFSNATDESYVEISIADTGTGMDQRTRNRIFEPFFTTKEKGKGTGLGLAVVYGIVKSHAGFVDLESEEGRGTSFHLYFPLRPIDAKAA